MDKTAAQINSQWLPVVSLRFQFVQQYIIQRTQKADGNTDTQIICDDADYAWDRVINPRPLPSAVVTPIR